MNKFVTTALATAVAGSASFADPGDSEWLELDSEITNLARSLRPAQDDGLGFAVLFRGSYVYSGDNIGTGTGANSPDLNGFSLEDVDVALWGAEENYGFRVGMDLSLDAGRLSTTPGTSGGDIRLEDAYGYWTCGEWFTATLGQFKPRVVHSGYIDPGNQLFIDRTALGAKFDFWDVGAGANGDFEAFSWYASLHNGSDGTASKYLIVARAEMALGEAGSMANLAAAKEGARGAGEGLNGIVGASYYYNDLGNSAPESWGVFADFNGNVGPFGVGAEIGYLARDVSTTIGDPTTSHNGVDWSEVNIANPIGFQGDSYPWALTGSFLISPEFEAGARFESLDNGRNNGPDNNIFSAVLNWYIGEGRAKWQAQWSYFDGRGNAQDGSIFQLGLSVGASR